MGTRSAVAVRNENGGIKGRYIHWDGDSVGDDVRALIARDGVETVVKTIVMDHYGWSGLDLRQDDSLSAGHNDGRFVAVPGYGVAYTTKGGQSSPDEWVTAVGDMDTEFVHVIEDDGSVTTLT